MDWSRLEEYKNDPKYKTYYDVGLFFILIFSFHFIYLLWNEVMDFWPIKGTIDSLFAWASALLFDQSTWVLDHVFRIDIVTKGQSIFFINSDGGYSASPSRPNAPA